MKRLSEREEAVLTVISRNGLVSSFDTVRVTPRMIRKYLPKFVQLGYVEIVNGKATITSRGMDAFYPNLPKRSD